MAGTATAELPIIPALREGWEGWGNNGLLQV